MTKQIVVRGVDLQLWRHFRADAIAHQMTTGELLNHVLAEWRKTLPDGPYLVWQDDTTSDQFARPGEQRS